MNVNLGSSSNNGSHNQIFGFFVWWIFVAWKLQSMATTNHQFGMQMRQVLQRTHYVDFFLPFPAGTQMESGSHEQSQTHDMIQKVTASRRIRVRGYVRTISGKYVYTLTAEGEQFKAWKFVPKTYPRYIWSGSCHDPTKSYLYSLAKVVQKSIFCH